MRLDCWLKKPWFFLVTLAALSPAIKGCIQSKTGSFALWNIGHCNVSLSIKEHPLTQEVEKALAQPYYYLSSGGQAFVFVSQDKSYVLKFTRKDTLTPPLWSYVTLPQNRKSKAAKAQRLLNRDYVSYQIASSSLFDECALLSMHFNKTKNIYGNITLFDPLGISHNISLDETDFILQKKGELLYAYIKKRMLQGEEEKVCKAIDEVIALFLARWDKGIHDEDAKIYRNLGFYEDKPFFLDTGRFILDAKYQDKHLQKELLEKEILRLKNWLDDHFPSLSTHLQKRLSSL
jgi:hypothetical protein